MLEKTISNDIRLAISEEFPDARIFTNPCGTAYSGKYLGAQNGVARLLGARPIDFGLFPGSTDLVGWRSIRITPDLVGTLVAIFVGIEVKQPKGKHQQNQKKFLKLLEAAGAITGTARSVTDGIQIMRRFEIWNVSKTTPLSPPSAPSCCCSCHSPGQSG